MIKIYESTANTDLNEKEAEKYIKFCESELNRLYPDYEICVIDDDKLNDKITVGYEFDVYTIEDDLIEDIRYDMAQMWDKFKDSQNK